MGATFAASACWSAKLRDKDDYKNAVVGGVLAGLIFGYKGGQLHITGYIIHVPTLTVCVYYECMQLVRIELVMDSVWLSDWGQ